MTAKRRAAITAVAFFLGGTVITSLWWHQPICLAQSGVKTPFSRSSIPMNLRERFHHYAVRDACGREVLTPTGFLACLCLFDNEEMQLLENTGHDCLPIHIRQCLERLFYLMDVDHDRSITYIEFCIFFSLISARRKHLEMAFTVFDKNEDYCLSQHEFRHLLNALMVDHSIQIVKKRDLMGQLVPSPLTQDVVYSLERKREAKLPSQETDALTMTKDAFFTSPLVKRLFGPNGDSRLSFEDFFSIIREIREDVWALQFGLHDPNNTGLINRRDFQRILFRGIGKSGSTNNGASHNSTRGLEEEQTPTSWDFYRKTFEILFEYDTVGRGMELALRAKTSLPLSSSTKAGPQENERGQHRMGATNSEIATINPSGNNSDGELDSEDFHRVLEGCRGLPNLTPKDVAYFMCLFDTDGSGKLSPSEFEKACRLCTTFFSPRRPRFREPRRNAVQQFVYCMQQLK